MTFRRFLAPESIRLALTTRLEPPGGAPADFDPLGQRNLNRVREEVIQELTDLLAASGDAGNPNRLFKDLLDREKKAVTAVGEGVAFPHVRTLQVKRFIMAFGRSEEGLPFAAPDGEPVHLFFAMVAPPYDDRTYLKAYRSLAKLLLEPEHRELFMTARDASEILRALELVKE
jgi:mannitol/fructose-specific phosphotransferase system IIA component (Ntr-type)